MSNSLYTEAVVNELKTELYNEMLSCTKCDNCIGSPFCFPLKTTCKTPIMVITMCPSLDTVYSQITSVKFFRQLCSALFGGKENFDKYLREIFDKDNGNVYWTHYYKCHNPKVFATTFGNLSDVCKNKFLEREIDLAAPDLIIVFGKEIIKNLFGVNINCGQLLEQEIIINSKTYKVLCSDISNKFGIDEHLMPLRKEIKKYLPWVFDGENSHYKLNKNNFIDYDYQAVLKLAQVYDVEIKADAFEDSWYNEVIIPNLKMSTVFQTVYSFIESKVKTVIVDSCNRNHTEFREDFESSNSANWVYTFVKVMKPFIRNANFAYKVKEDLCDKIFSMKDRTIEIATIRNNLVHERGIVGKIINKRQRQDEKVSEFDGITVYANTVFINEKGMKKLFKLCKDYVDIIKLYYENV